MKINKAFRFRIYPDAEQENLLRRTAGCCRFVYNLCLSQMILERHRSEPRRITQYDQIKELPALKREAEWLREVPNHPLQQAVIDLHRAFRNFFEGRAKFPTFKSKGDRDSFRYPDPKQIKISHSAVFLPKAGWVEWVMHRPIEGEMRNSTVVREADAWYVSIQCETEMEEPVHASGSAVGIDLGIDRPIVLSTGEVFMLPRVTKEEQKKLADLQRRVGRKTKGSRNRRKAMMAVSRFLARLKRRRKDALHKATTRIAKNHGYIVVEDLQLLNMTSSARGTVEEPGRNVRQKAGLNRALQDVAMRQFRILLQYKVQWLGGTLVAVPPRNTSRTCHECGHVSAENRKTQASFLCVSCGHAENADINAARNILRLGLAAGGHLVMACGSS